MERYLLIIIAVMALAGCGSKETEDKAASASSAPVPNNLAQSIGTFTDSRDGNTYKTVTVGSQTWFAENLNFDAKGSACYENENANCAKYGRLYNWKTARKACPTGFHLSSEDDWKALVDYAGGDKNAGKKLKSKSGWKNNGNGTDDYGWSALPGGVGGGDRFTAARSFGVWWMARRGGQGMDYDGDGMSWFGYDNKDMFSVRCVQD